MSHAEVKEKKVELIELFYDLIYVYAISKMTLLVEEPEEGILTLEMFALYIIASMIIIQVWLYMVTYINRYATWRWYEYVLVIINMASVIMMSNTLSVDFESNSMAFFFSMMIMLGCIGAMYAIQIYVERQDITAAKHDLEIIQLILAIYIIAVIVNVMGYKEASLMITIGAIIIGAMLPFVKKGDFDMKIVSFPHLVERLELLTIITFGEAIVGITGFFDAQEFNVDGVVIFLTVVLMFGAYVAQVHYLCNHHQVVKPTKMMWSHHGIIISVNLVTVALLYFGGEDADHTFTAGLMMVAMTAFYLSLHSTSGYYHPEFEHGWKDVAKTLAVMAVATVIVFAFLGSPWGFMLGSLFAAACNFYMLWHKYSSTRCVNVIHTKS